MMVHGESIPDETLELAFSAMPAQFEASSLVRAIEAHGFKQAYRAADRLLQKKRKQSFIFYDAGVWRRI